MAKAILLGNGAIARAVVEAGCEVAAAYPGTPSSEILPAIAWWADQLGTNTAVEWGTNEKVAFEVAVSVAMSGKRSCAVMKQVGLNVAADPFMSTALMRQKGGFLLIVSDDPGPHSSQTEQDSRMFAWFAKIPCFDPASVSEAMKMVASGFELSERFGITVMLRPTGKVDHARQNVELQDEIMAPRLDAKFEKDQARWVCLPARVKDNHPRVNGVIAEIREAFETEFSQYNYEVPAPSGKARLGVIAGGTTFAFLTDLLAASGRNDIDILKIGTPVPLPLKMCQNFIDNHDKVLVLEQTYPVIEDQLSNRTGIMGRHDGTVPSAGELTPEVIEIILARALGEEAPAVADPRLAEACDAMGVKVRPPMLCPGCPHRSSFFSIRQALPRAINPSDIGCYTLGVMQKGCDTVIDMGAAVTASSGHYLAQKVNGKIDRPIIATIGDSTFFHSGITGLINAHYNRHSFVLCILDNRITAMTGGQSSPNVGDKLRKGEKGREVPLEPLCRGMGLSYVKTIDAYDIVDNKDEIKKAWEWSLANEEPAVLIFLYPCITMLKIPPQPKPVTVEAKECIGCRFCITQFNCPGLVFDDDGKKAYVDHRYCVQCGVCVPVCPHGAIHYTAKGGDA